MGYHTYVERAGNTFIGGGVAQWAGLHVVNGFAAGHYFCELAKAVVWLRYDCVFTLVVAPLRGGMEVVGRRHHQCRRPHLCGVYCQRLEACERL